MTPIPCTSMSWGGVKKIDQIHDGWRELMHKVSVPEDGFDIFGKFKHNYVLIDQDEQVPDFPFNHEVTEEVDWGLKREVLREVLSTLSEREQKVLNGRFFEYLTLEEVGKIIGVQRERARQIESHALRKLRHPLRAEKLKKAFMPERWEQDRLAKLARLAEKKVKRNSCIFHNLVEEIDEDAKFVAEMKRVEDEERKAQEAADLPGLHSYSFTDIFGHVKWVVR